MNKHVYMAVTTDIYETPVFIADTVKELSNLTGVSENSIRSSISRGYSGRNRKLKFLKVEME